MCTEPACALNFILSKDVYKKNTPFDADCGHTSNEAQAGAFRVL